MPDREVEVSGMGEFGDEGAGVQGEPCRAVAGALDMFALVGV